MHVKQPPQRRSFVAVAAVFGVVVATAGACTISSAQPMPIAPATGALLPLPDTAGIAARFTPTVVNIRVSGTYKVSTSDDATEQDSDEGSGSQDADAMRDFLRRFQQRFGGLPREMRLPVRGEGSGFIVRSDGVILTNAHVINDAEEVLVKLTDRREFRAKVLGADALTDIAVLKIDATDLPVVSLAPPQPLRVGEWVLAIGSPFGFESSVTVGVISATRRSLPGGGVPFIQTDTAVNPGNSGGPLFNMRGEVIGINAQIYSRTGGYQGLSFAIPIDVARRAEEQILRAGQVRHARLGVTLQELDQTLAESFKLDKATGALIDDVEKGGPADRAGLESGNVVLAVNGQAVNVSGDVSAMLGLAAPGDPIDLDVWHQGARRTFHARLDEAIDHAARNADAVAPSPKGRLGLALRPLQPDERRDSGAPSGLLIEGVSDAAARAGLQPGDLLLAIDGQPVSTVAQADVAAGGSNRSVALLVQRGARKVYVPLRLV